MNKRNLSTLGVLLALSFCGLATADQVAVEDFDSIKLYTLKNKAGTEIKVTNYGAIITSGHAGQFD